jgi:hypothetical protein
MPNCDFYALATDLVGVLDFIFAQPGWMLVELASQHDRPLREFHATQEVLAAYPSFDRLDPALYFHLYSPAMGGRVVHKRIDFNFGAVPDATFRYDAQGWGLIQLYFGRLRDGRLSPCHTNHNSERRAQNGESPSAVDEIGPVAAWSWAEVARVSGRLNRFIRKIAAGRIHSRPVLPAAHEAHARGALQLALAAT